jgi:hypothetical protein
MRTGTDKSVILILFEKIEVALAQLLTDNTIRSVEIWNGQDENEENERPRNYPYVAVEINVDWERIQATNSYEQIQNIQQNKQNGSATVTIHTMVQSLKNESLSFVENEPIRFLVHRAINLLQDDEYFTKLQRINTPAIPMHKRVYDLMTVYNCDVFEAAGQNTSEERILEVELQPEFDITDKSTNT